MDIIHVFRAWNRCVIEDDSTWLDTFASIPRDLMMTWEPWRLPTHPKNPWSQPDFSLQRIASGFFDKYTLAFLDRLARLPAKIYLRPMHEMNGDWYPWGATVNGNRPEHYVAAWHHLNKLASKVEADNLSWVWSPYIRDYPPVTENAMENCWPGDDCVDIVGLDGYNWGDTPDRPGWQSFTELFAEAIRRPG